MKTIKSSIRLVAQSSWSNGKNPRPVLICLSEQGLLWKVPKAKQDLKILFSKHLQVSRKSSCSSTSWMLYPVLLRHCEQTPGLAWYVPHSTSIIHLWNRTRNAKHKWILENVNTD